MATSMIRAYFAKKKAKLEILVEEKTICIGEQVNGKLVITALKSLDINQTTISLNIAVSRRNSKGQKKSRRLYKEVFSLNNPVLLGANQQEEMTFTLAMPNKQDNFKVFEKIKKSLNTDHNLDCNLIANISCKGVNLKVKKRLVFIEKGLNDDVEESDSLFS